MVNVMIKICVVPPPAFVGNTLTPQCDCVTIFLVKTSRIWKIRLRLLARARAPLRM